MNFPERSEVIREEEGEEGITGGIELKQIANMLKEGLRTTTKCCATGTCEG